MKWNRGPELILNNTVRSGSSVISLIKQMRKRREEHKKSSFAICESHKPSSGRKVWLLSHDFCFLLKLERFLTTLKQNLTFWTGLIIYTFVRQHNPCKLVKEKRYALTWVPVLKVALFFSVNYPLFGEFLKKKNPFMTKWSVFYIDQITILIWVYAHAV